MRILFLCMLFNLAWAVPVVASQLKLTQEEQAYVDAHPVLRAQTLEGDFLPYVFNKQGEIRGLSVDLIMELSQIIGVEIQLSGADEPEVAFYNLVQNQVDILFPMVATPSRMKLMRFSDPLNEGVAGIVVPADHQMKVYLKDYEGRRVGIINMSYFKKALSVHYPDIEQVIFESNQSLLDAVDRREVEAGISAISVLNHLINSDYNDKLRIEKIDGSAGRTARFSTRIAVHPENEILQSLLNRAIALLDQKTRTEIEDKWHQNKDLPDLPHLSFQELEYLKSLDTLHYCIDPNWVPFAKIENGKHEGLTADHLQIVTDPLQIDVQVYPTNSWRESIDAFKAGHCQLLPFALRTPDREHFMVFSRSYYDSPLMIATRSEQVFIDDLADSGPLSLGVVSGAAYAELVGRWYPNIRVIAVKNVIEGLKRVQQGEIDGFLDIMPVLQYYMNTESIGNIKIGGRLDERLYFSFAFSPELKPLVAIFNKTIATISDQKLSALKNKWLALEVRKTQDNTLVWLVVGVFTVILSATFFAYRRLAVVNKALEKSQYELRITNEKLANIAITDSLTQIGNRKFLDDKLTQEITRVNRYQRALSVMMLDVDHFKIINDTLGHQLGDKMLVELALLLQKNIRQTDTLGRWGGEEFMVILPETAIEETRLVANKLRKVVEQHLFSAARRQTVSLGVAQLQEDESSEDLIRRIDLALYRAKDKGRNRVESG